MRADRASALSGAAVMTAPGWAWASRECSLRSGARHVVQPERCLHRELHGCGRRHGVTELAAHDVGIADIPDVVANVAPRARVIDHYGVVRLEAHTAFSLETTSATVRGDD